MNELGLLPKIDHVSSVSGGAIMAGLLAARWSSLDFENEVAVNFDEEVILPIWNLCSRTIDWKSAAISLIPGVNGLDYYYRKYLVDRATLQDTPDRPEFIFNAAHLETGRNWIFSKPLMRTYKLGVVENPTIPLATVIAASSSFPLVFPPVVVNMDPSLFKRSDYAELFDDERLKRRVSLTDGGVYDNLGYHAIRHHEVILISDASGPLEVKAGRSISRRLHNRVKRPLDIAVEQTRALRRSSLIKELKTEEKKGAFWMISTPLGRYKIEPSMEVPDYLSPDLGFVRTKLNRFSTAEKTALIHWGYLQCDMSIRDNYKDLKNVDPTDSFPVLPTD